MWLFVYHFNNKISILIANVVMICLLSTNIVIYEYIHEQFWQQKLMFITKLGGKQMISDEIVNVGFDPWSFEQKSLLGLEGSGS